MSKYAVSSSIYIKQFPSLCCKLKKNTFASSKLFPKKNPQEKGVKLGNFFYFHYTKKNPQNKTKHQHIKNVSRFQSNFVGFYAL